MNLAWAYKNKIHLLGKAFFLFSAGKAGLIIILVLCVSIFACNRINLWDNEYLTDDTPIILPDVTMISATGGNTIITAEWIDPDISDLNRVEITCTDVAGTMEVLPGIQTCTITGLTNGNEYTVNITVVDSDENTSAGISFTIAPSATPVEGHFIYTREDLNAVRGGVTGYDDWTLDDTYYLMADLDLSGYDPAGDGYGWVPIGWSLDMLTFSDFTGTFEGNNHTISNLTISRGSDQNIGLFRYNSGTVANLILANVNIAGGSNTGSISGLNSGIIDSCQASGNLTGSWDCTGGFAGSNSDTISNSSSSVTVNGNIYIGGLVGENQNSGTITDSSASGNVTGTDYYTGGLVGQNNGTISTTCHATGKVIGIAYVGGLIGSNSRPLTECYATGAVQGSGSNIGGFIGYNSGALTTCHSAGAVSVTTGYCDFIGGLVGNNIGAINGCYTTYTSDMTVTLTAMTGTTNVGGIVGFTTGTITGSNAAGDVNVTFGNPSAAVAVSGNVGGLVGHAFNSTISGSSASGSVRASMEQYTTFTDSLRVGGLAGHNNNTAIDNNSNVTGTVTVVSTGNDAENNYAGGLVGESTGTITNSNTTNTCEVSATLALTATTSCLAYVGGLAGSSTAGITGSDSDSDVTVNITASGPGTENLYAGGLIGNNISTVTSCDATGAVRLSSSSYIDYIYAGGLIGNNSGTITNCHQSTGSINASSSYAVQGYIGGLVGDNTQPITDSDAAGTVFAAQIASSAAVGGLVGYNSSTITGSHAAGGVSSGSYLGGFIGNNVGGAIDNCYATGDVTGDHYIGGFVGYNDSVSGITRSFATGDVYGDQGGIGGFVGVNNSGPIENSYARGAVSGANPASAYGLAGFVGYKAASDFYCCYSTGSVITVSTPVGGFCGTNAGGAINLCYYDYEESEQTDDDGRGSPRSTDDMTYPYNSSTTYLSWDFYPTGTNDIWTIDATNEGYPYFYIP